MNIFLFIFLVLNCYFRLVQNNKIGLIGIPFKRGQLKPGVDYGPQVLRSIGLIDHLKDIGNFELTDFGNVNCESIRARKSMISLTLADDVCNCIENTYTVSKQVLQSGIDHLITIGGDHSVSPATIFAHLETNPSNVGLIWVDAHADINTPNTSLSGNMHGMPVSMVLKDFSEEWNKFSEIFEGKHRLSAKDIAYIGLRDLDKAERMILKKFGIVHFGMSDIVKNGIVNVLNGVLSAIDPSGEKSLHLSFDIDALDPLEAPSTGTPVRGGMALREAITMIEELHNTGRLRVFELFELNPLVGETRDVEKTLNAAVHLLMASTGYKRT